MLSVTKETTNKAVVNYPNVHHCTFNVTIKCYCDTLLQFFDGIIVIFIRIADEGLCLVILRGNSRVHYSRSICFQSLSLGKFVSQLHYVLVELLLAILTIGSISSRIGSNVFCRIVI